MPRRASRAVPLRVVLKGTASDPLVIESTRAPLRPVFHTSSGTLPRRSRLPRILHDILDQLWVDHQPEPVHSPFQDPTQKLDGRLAASQKCTSLKNMVCPTSSVNSYTLAGGPTST